MRSFWKLAVLSATGAAYALLALPVQANTTSAWDHNGSLMRFEEDGKKRKFVYDRPREALATAGIRVGAVLFDGEEKTDGRLAGYAKLFRKGCDPVDYFVEGAYDKAKGELLLQGQAPIYSGEGCKITGYSEEGTASSLRFTYQTGGNNEVARYGRTPDEATASQSYQQSPADPADEDANYDDPRPAPRAYGSRDYVPRDDFRRDYADQRDGLRPRRYEGAYPAPVEPEDVDEDPYYEEEEEPAYRPYRPWWQRY